MRVYKVPWNKVTIEANLVTLPDIYWQLKEILASRMITRWRILRSSSFTTRV